MSIKELSKAQLQELKRNYYSEKYGSTSYGVLADIDSFVEDEEIFSEYASVDFVDDDFFTPADDESV